jgi:hypothetical protein
MATKHQEQEQEKDVHANADEFLHDVHFRKALFAQFKWIQQKRTKEEQLGITKKAMKLLQSLSCGFIESNQSINTVSHKNEKLHSQPVYVYLRSVFPESVARKTCHNINLILASALQMASTNVRKRMIPRHLQLAYRVLGFTFL